MTPLKIPHKYQYTVREDYIKTKEGDQYIGYGIEIWKAGERIQSVPDIFLHIYDAKTLADLCNRIQLDPIHFSDVVEDCLP